MNLKIAIQKSGRLHEESVKLLKECGIDISTGGNKLRSVASNFPVEVYFLRDDDIPEYVQDAVADIGIVGENVVYEKRKKIDVLEKLGFGKCRLSIAIGRNEIYERSNLNGKRIATTYPVLVNDFLQKNNIQAEIHEISGSVEIAPGIGLAEAVCDLVSSGSTLLMNGLKEAEVILESQAILVGHQNLANEKKEILEKLLFRIRSVKKAKKFKYILLNAPNDRLSNIISKLPGMRSPTVLPLAETGWSSVHSVIEEDDFWNIIEQLREAGGEGILVVPIEKMIL